jgi:hypothetical protein
MPDNTTVEIKTKINEVLVALPPEGIAELRRYLDRLTDKYQIAQPAPIIALSGLWSDVPFEIDDTEVRSLRRRITDTTLDRG